MKNIKLLLNESKDIRQFSVSYFKYLASLLNRVDINSIAIFTDELEAARRDHNTVFFIGNGGSASTASHMANDFGLGSRANINPPLRAMSLTDNTASITAIANDCGYDNVFIRQLYLYYKPGDKLVAISASGNSPNIIAATKWVKKQGGKVIGLVGFDGGKLKRLSDVCIHIKTPKGEYGPVEDIHMILDHLIYTWLWHKQRNKER